MMKKVAIVMGSKSDMPVVQKAVDRLSDWGIPTVVRILSAHRTPDEVSQFSASARENDIGVIIAAAGKAAALPGALAALTTLPVIGLPIQSSFMDGLDSLLSMTQMPPGVPVATVGTNASDNAAILAAQILGVYDEGIDKTLTEYKNTMRERVLKDDSELNG